VAGFSQLFLAADLEVPNSSLGESMRRLTQSSSSMRKGLALVTWSGLPQGAESERLMLPHLAAAGVETEIVDWRSTNCDFSKFDLIVLRSCWDYHLHAAEFIDWLQRVEHVAPILNAVDTVLWNHNKFYLREVEALGIEIARTVFVNGSGPIASSGWQEIRNWKKSVVKPAVSASAHKTWLFDSAAVPDEDELKNKMEGEAFLIQQFIPEIETHGEISFIYIDGAYSHAVQKRPAAGDFRVQQEHGGSAELFHPDSTLLDQANEIASTVAQVRDSLYCRIDAVARDGTLVLMELELIEPELFLGMAEGAAERFAKAIAKRIK
jgi:glutathione synthase/RimK-type ligase-like ATP-grasp enzyme